MVSGDKAPTKRVHLGHLATDLSFMSRVLRAHVHAFNTGFADDQDVAAGVVALLNLIDLNPGISQNDLAAAVVLKKSAVTRLISSLEDDGLVRRMKVDGDKRFNALHLTEAGDLKLSRLRQFQSDRNAKFMQALDADEQETFFTLLGKLTDSFTDETTRA